METEHDKNDEVTTSSSDVYSTPIALGFEVLTESSPSSGPAVVYGPSNFSEIEPSTCLVSYNKDVRDAAAVRGRCGLYNLGNTCFMNAGLQCLTSTMPLVKFLLGYYQNRKTLDDTLFGQFQKLFAKIWSGQFSIVHPKDFKQTLGIYHTQFQDYRQHDCQEFLALLLDSLHEQLNFKSQSTNQNTEAGPSCEKQPITFEHNINNRGASNLGVSEGENRVNDKSKNAATSHSSLTFDNMKESKFVQSEKVMGDELKSDYYEKRKSGSNIAGFTVNPISEDSNHSTLSEQSSESEQCSVMKNLKLRSSPTVSQSSVGLSPRVVNELGEKVCDVTSSDDINIGKNEITDECESSGIEGFKRVHSLQDFRSKQDECLNVLMKASSDNDLVSKASGDVDEADDFDSGFRMNDETSQMGQKNNVSVSLKPECCDIEQKSSCVDEISECSSEPFILNNAISTTSVPSLEDLYAKETKTLNTNVLATEYMEESITTDSDKFSKHDNTSERIENVDEEDLINNVMEVTTKNDGFEMPKKVKDVNIRADKKSKSPKGACGSNSGMGSEKEDCFSLSGVKRMKFEGTEKNLQMQEICKIQKEALISEALNVKKPKNVERVEKISCTREASPSVDSDIESDMVEDQDEDNEMEVSDNEAEEMLPQGPRTLAEGACYTTAEVLAAEDAWQKYLRRNDSIVVDTFQGQFKSTVVCARCSQVSVTFEPFMYLSVPIPHAMERQLCITFISLRSEPLHLLLEMHKQDKILKVKQELCNLIGGNPSDIIIAEVLDWHISRILEDNTMLRYINDSSRKMYAFEMDQSMTGSALESETPSGLNVTPATSQDSITAQADVFNDVGTFFVNSNVNLGSDNFPEASPYYDQSGSADFKNTENLDMVGTSLWEWNQGGSDKRRGSLETETGENPVVDSTTSVTGFDITEDVARAESHETAEMVEKSTVTSSTVTTDDWKSCAICLEEMPENELMVHTTCGGTFCSACLEMSAQHYRDSVYCCPVCSTPADMTEDFVPLTNAANHKPKTRIVAIPISYRCEKDISGANNPYLFAHPSLLNLPSNLTGQHIYTCIRSVIPDLQDFKILLTDGTGLHCSRCLYMEHCSGCEIPQDGEAILRPGDHLAVSVQSVTEEQVVGYQRLMEHKSMEKQSSNDPITLLDCFRAFTQSEELDEHNPWFCPHCKENQRAKKTMTVWQYPDTLIIQLKRFVFHELSSTKVDNKVVFPIDNLDLNEFISGPKTKNLMYNLYSLVCHFGGANSGHYTAYAKHPVDGQWCYYNDETVTESIPGDEEFTSTYVLFYQRKGTDKALQIPDDLDLAFEAEGTDSVASSSIPNVIFQPPQEDITLNLNSKAASTSSNIAPPTSCQTATSTSCHQVAASSGACDLFDSADQSERRTEDYTADSSCVRAELAEADSTGPTYEFYS
ncbi:uncharacterized protein LOC123554858 [Mercenaria mercenaria]|uniref:uncharacterized protein LOC123554858 n=1 Tax=Mercenaria mercenaria TaxID=6596 RepID=UPI00234F22B4|nr:uncharacterized protein LOC123554858 [Mercenaria mercenaria]XP_053403630.1 uncharacterized protein LOC123554858 [Mercenaria mercenaria]